MASRQPLVTGSIGWGSTLQPPDFLPERSPALNFGYRRFPAALRVLGFPVLESMPCLSESEIYAAVRWWMRLDVKNTLARRGDVPESAEKLRVWLGYRENGAIRTWWKRHYAWRSPREFRGWTNIEAENGIPHIEPYEVANFRLPDDISCDADVVCFKAWCEGVHFRFMVKENPLKEGYPDAIRTGLIKFCRSPWVCFAMAAPYMQPTGVLFPGTGYIDSCLRLEWLLKHPYEASQGELRYILASEMFKAGRKHRRVASRRHDQEMRLIPSGGWYVGGSIREALGPDFRRGAEWTGYKDGKRNQESRR